jgi:hypothetical protein
MTNQISLIKQTDIIITVASWEERFITGMYGLIDAVTAKSIIMFFYKEYYNWSKDNIEKLKNTCKERGINIISKELSFASSFDTWGMLVNTIQNDIQFRDYITIDISTMPREAIWIICHLLDQKGYKIQYTYHTPNAYPSDWLSRDPGKPRLVYKLAGISKLNKPTTLVILTGFDIERARQLVRYFEPDNLLLGIQTGMQYENLHQNRERHEAGFTRHRGVKYFDIDGYSVNNCLLTLENETRHFKDSNVVISSLGPKLSALALYEFKVKNKDIALSYAPSNEYNHEYSSGYKDRIIGILHE